MIERIGAAMQRIGAVIGNEVKSLAIQCKLRAADAVGISPGDRAEMARQRLVFLQRSETERKVVEPARAVGHIDLGDDAAIAEEAHAQSVVVGHRVDFDCVSVPCGPVGRMIERPGGVRCLGYDSEPQNRAYRIGTNSTRADFGIRYGMNLPIYLRSALERSPEGHKGSFPSSSY